MAKRDLSIDDLDSINGGFLPLLALGAAYLGPTATVALVGVGTAAALMAYFAGVLLKGVA